MRSQATDGRAGGARGEGRGGERVAAGRGTGRRAPRLLRGAGLGSRFRALGAAASIAAAFSVRDSGGRAGERKASAPLCFAMRG